MTMTVWRLTWHVSTGIACYVYIQIVENEITGAVTHTQITQKSGQPQTCFNQLSRGIWRSSISISTKVQPHRAHIQPLLLCGSETWALTPALGDRIAAFDNICLRRILRIPYTDHVTNADVQYDSELALHRSCCRSFKQDGSVSSGMWQGTAPLFSYSAIFIAASVRNKLIQFKGWVIRKTRPELFIRRSAGWPRTGGAAQDASTSHLATDHGSRPSAAQSRTELSVATRPGSRTMDAARGNDCGPVRGLSAMMMMMMMISYI